MMRFLTVKYGVLFVESRNTVASMREEEPITTQELGTLRRWFRPLYRVYGIRKKSKKTKYLFCYHLFVDYDTRKNLITDCKVMKMVYDTFELKHHIKREDIPIISSKTGFSELTVEESIRRLSELSDSIRKPWLRIFPFIESMNKGMLHIGSKIFYFTL